MKRKLFAVLALMLALMLAFGNVTVLASSQANVNNPQGASMEYAPLSSQSKVKNLPDSSKSYGTLTSNAWRTTGNGFISGNTRQWNYQVSAEYKGSKTVEKIRTTWRGSASLRNSASITLGISNSGGSAGTSSSWQSVNTVSKYWENSNGAKSSSWSSNMIVTPSKDYRDNTIALVNTAVVILTCDKRPFEISAGV